MADSEKGNSSTKESKANTSLLDDDFSKDFLSSWKSISAVGDDMDFNFEPVNKGKKKAFDFGMDMDFSLDDAFGKMSSFKIDTPDLDFSSSPKKITKSTEKPEEDSSKGNHPDKHDKFAFSFDFNGLDDFGLDAPSTKPGKSPSTEKSNKNDGSECEDLPRQVTKDKKETAEDSISKGPVSAEESKGYHLEKQDNFAISFEFDGLDDFGLDASSTKARKSPSTEKNNKKDGSECEDLPRQLTKDKKETAEVSVNKRPVMCEDAAFSKSEDMVVGDIPSVNWDSKSAVFSYPVQEKETHISSGKKHVEYPHKIDHQSYNEGETTSNKSCSLVREGIIGPIPADKTPSSTGSLMPVELADVRMSLGTQETVNCLSVNNKIQPKDEEFSIQSHTQLNEMNCSTKTPLAEASLQINISEEVEVSSPERKANDGSAEGSIVAQELPAAVDLTSVAEKLIIDKSPQQCSTEKMDISDGKSELGSTDCLGLLDTVDPSVNCCKKVLSSSDRSFSERQNSVLKESPALIGRGPTSAKRMLIGNEVPGAMNSNILVSKATNDVSRTELSAYRYKKEASAHIGAADKSNSVSCKNYGHSNHIDKKSDGNPSSCTKKLMKPESVSEKSEKIAAGHNPPRDQEDNGNGKKKNDISISKVPPSGQEAKNGLPSLLCEKMINNVKSSGFKIPSLSPEQGTKAGNQGQGNVKDNISSISSIEKSNIGQGNKLSSQRIEKKMLALPSLKLTRTTTDKQLVTPTKQRNLISPGNFEKSTRLQAVTKMVSPISGEKLTASTLSLKRKTSEAADVGPVKLHTPKGLSPNASRMCKVSAKELGDGVQTQGDFLEGSRKKVTVDCKTPRFDFVQEANIEALQFSMMVENDENVEKAEACAKELDNICNMLKKKHEEAKELLVRALVNNNNLLMLNHPIYEEKIRSVQRLASRLLTRELEVNS